MLEHLEIGRRQIAYRLRDGASPTLVFFPGYASDMEGTKALALDAFVERHGLSMLRFDYSGTGSSGGNFEDGTLGIWLEDALAAVDQLTEGPLILVGSSMGGWLALHVALLRRERVQALAGIAAAPDFTDWGFTIVEKDELHRLGRLERPNPYGPEPEVVTRAFWESGEELTLLDGDIAIDCPVRLVHGGFLQDWLTYPTDWNWRLESKLGGELRAVSDIGTHWLDLIQWLTGEKVTELCADLATVIPVRHKPRGHVESFGTAGNVATDEVPISTDDYASVLIHLEHGIHGVFTVSQVSPGRKCALNFEINGSDGSLSWNGEDPNTLWIGRRNEPNGKLIKDPSLLSKEARPYAAYPGGHAEGYPDTFVQLFHDFYNYIAAGNFSAPRRFPTFQTGHDELILCEAIQKSAQSRSWTRLEWD